MDASREFLLEKFTIALKQMRESRLVFAQAMPLPEKKPISVLPCARIIIPLDGRMPFAYSDGQEMHAEEFLPGTTIYARPYGWSNPGWNTPQEFVSLVFQHDYLRFLHIVHDGSEIAPDAPEYGPVEGKSVYHTASGPSRTIALLIGVMNSYSDSPEADRTLALECLDLLFRESLEQLRRDQPVKTGKSRRLWQNIRNYMRENFHQDISREQIAERFLLTPCYVSRLFMAHGENFNSYLLSLRMNQAQHLLEHSHISVKEIAYHTGFNSTGYFIKAFSARFGVTPGAYRTRFEEAAQAEHHK